MEATTSQALGIEPVPALWAVDPAEKKLQPSAEALSSVYHLLGNSFAKVHPVHICTDDETSLEEARTEVQQFLSSLNLGQSAFPEVYRSPSGKKSDCAERVLNLAHSKKAQVILMTSHGRSAIGATFLGSFAQEILKKSDLPLLFMTRTHPKVGSKVLFATDFSEVSKQAFLRFLNLVKGKTSEVILCHIVNFPLPMMNVAETGAAVALPDSFWEDQKEWAEKETQQWIQEAKNHNISVQLQNLIEESISSPATTLQKIAERENVGLIGLVSHVGPFEKLVLGSVTQDLMSSQKFNLWVCGPHFGK